MEASNNANGQNPLTPLLDRKIRQSFGDLVMQLNVAMATNDLLVSQINDLQKQIVESKDESTQTDVLKN